MTNKVLVAGGGGFIGSHLCDSLVADGHTVYCLDNFCTGQRRNVDHLVDHPNFTLIEADVLDRPELSSVDRIYYLASRASPVEFETEPIHIALTNSEGLRNLLDHAVDCDARLLFASTSEVYGDPEVHPQDESYRGNVNVRGPRACYDEAKRFGEALAGAYETEHGVDVRTARIFNTYGPRMRADDGRVVPNFVLQALRGDPLTVYGDGSQTRSFCYVSDTVRGLRALMETAGLDGEVVNLGQETEVTIREFADVVCEVVGTGTSVTYEPLPTDDPMVRRPVITKARDLLGWEPTVPLQDGLGLTVDYFRETLDLNRPLAVDD